MPSHAMSATMPIQKRTFLGDFPFLQPPSSLVGFPRTPEPRNGPVVTSSASMPHYMLAPSSCLWVHSYIVFKLLVTYTYRTRLSLRWISLSLFGHFTEMLWRRHRVLSGEVLDAPQLLCVGLLLFYCKLNGKRLWHYWGEHRKVMPLHEKKKNQTTMQCIHLFLGLEKKWVVIWSINLTL